MKQYANTLMHTDIKKKLFHICKIYYKYDAICTPMIYRLSFCNLVGMFDLVCCQLNCNVCHCAIHPSYSCTCHYHYVTS